MNPSSSPTVYTSNYPTISPPSYSPSSSITNYPTVVTPSYSPSQSITNYPTVATPSQSITNYPTVATPSHSPSQSIFSLNPSVYNTPTPTVYSLSTPIYIHQSNINDDDITIQKKYVGLYIGLTLFVIFGLLFYINMLYRKNKKLNKYIEYKKEYVQQPIGRVKVRNIFTSILLKN
jgi:hypothetical protein